MQDEVNQGRADEIKQESHSEEQLVACNEQETGVKLPSCLNLQVLYIICSLLASLISMHYYKHVALVHSRSANFLKHISKFVCNI